MGCKASLGKSGGEGRTDKEHHGSVDATRASYHLQKFSSVRAVMTHAPSVRMEALRLP